MKIMYLLIHSDRKRDVSHRLFLSQNSASSALTDIIRANKREHTDPYDDLDSGLEEIGYVCWIRYTCESDDYVAIRKLEVEQ